MPDIVDVRIMGELLRRLGCGVEHDRPGGVVAIDVPATPGHRADGDLARAMRASISVLGPWVTRRGAENAAREPEIVDLCRLLRRMGARIEGIGSSTLLVDGVDALTPVEHGVVPDRIVAGTWAFAAAVTGGDVVVRNGESGHLGMVLDKVTLAGAQVTDLPDGFRVVGPDRPRAIDVATLPYPGFPTDLQPFVITLDAVAEGTAMVTENLFEARLGFVQEIARLGARVRVDGHHAFVRGVRRLSAAPVEAGDIRAGAPLVVAALVADGETVIGGVGHVDRGYEHLDRTLRALGAQVSRFEPADVVLV